MYTSTVEAEEGRGPRYGGGRLARRRAAFATAGYLRHGFSDFKSLPFPPASYLRAVVLLGTGSFMSPFLHFPCLHRYHHFAFPLQFRFILLC